MEGVIFFASAPLLVKLSALLTEDYRLRAQIKPGIRFLKDELSSMYAVLQKLADKEDDQIDPLTKEWRNKVRELSHSIEDCVDRFVLSHSQQGSKTNIVRKVVRKVKMLPQDHRIGGEIQELKSLVSELSERAIRYGIYQYLAAPPPPVGSDARAPALLAETTDLVRIDGPRDEIIQVLETDQQKQRNVMGTLMPKLTAMLSKSYQLQKGVKHGIRFLTDELSSMDAILQILADKEDVQIDPQAKEWRNKVHDLSYYIEDCIDRFMLNHSQQGSSTKLFVRKAVMRILRQRQRQRIAKDIREFKSLVIQQSERASRYGILLCLGASPQQVVVDPRAPALFVKARDLVGIDGPREEITKLLDIDQEKQHKVVSIYGTAGLGKTTLAMELYHGITEGFDCKAFVSVSQTPDMNKLLKDMLSQISKSILDQSERLETEQLISTMREYLTDKRYFILIDNICDVSSWELLQSALPPNDNGSRIITTTSSKTVATACCDGIDANMYEARPLSDEDSHKLFFKRVFCSSEDFRQDLTKVSSDILSECGGLPLAIISIAGLLANRKKTKEVWVNTLKSISAEADKDSPIVDKMKRILLLSYFDLPHHLKSCLLYLSVFPVDYLIDCSQLILLWVAEALIPGQDRESMEQLGKTYLNDLISRSFVQPNKVGADGAIVETCKVHDVVLEFIVSKAMEDNFVTIWNRNGFSENYSSNKIRRLSIQEDISVRAEEIFKTIKNEAHIRSINIFGSNSVMAKHASVLSRHVLRVLNIDGVVKECYLEHVKCFGKKYQLARVVKHGISFLKDELSSMYAVLQKLSEKDYDQIDPQTKEWRDKVRELSYDIEDCINHVVLNSHGGEDVATGLANFVRKVMCNLTMLPQRHRIANEIKNLERLVREQSDRANRYGIYQSLASSRQKVLKGTESMNELIEDGMGIFLAENPSNGVQQGISQMGSSEIMELNILERIIAGSEKPSHLDLPLLQRITDNFSEKKEIGSGGCGKVYKGILRNGAVAVKRLHTIHTVTDKMFHREVKSLIAVKHRNIVQLLGYCSFTEEQLMLVQGGTIMVDIRERLLCFDYIRNGSLQSYITDELRGLEWHTRYQIIVGICTGLLYLHKEKDIIHMDLKPANILLDDHLVPKITDFGLSRLANNSQTTTTSRLMTPVYCAPEYSSEGRSSSKSDIYSLGVIIMEVVTGSKKNMPNITKVLRRWRHRWIKSSNHTALSYQQVTKCLELAQKCKQHDPTGRPDILDIIDELNQISDSTEDQFQVIPGLEDMLGIDPLETHFIFEELDRQISHSIELTNNTEDYFAFITKTSLHRLRTEPKKGIVPPRSKFSVTITMQSPVNAQQNNQCKAEITVLSTRVDGGDGAIDITEDMFIDKEGEVVDEVDVMVVLGNPSLEDES
ncbi:unnamed protein product [Urochloa decumbens]|uniref:non-specific serine/threonine protein kinase n=1 Tax=Urochloa decumbens TaxID=240449 RepID=A0ABC9AUP7_9POAL